MKTSLIIRTLLIPAAGCMLTSCETSGQLLTGGVCTCVAAVGVGILSLSFKSRKQITMA